MGGVEAWALAALATLAVAVVGTGFYRSALRALRAGRTNMDTLISLGATTAWISSLVKLVGHATGHLPEPEALWFGETAGLFTLVSIGHWLEARAGSRAGAAIRELLELQPDTASRLDAEGVEWDVPLAEVQPGDRLRIRPGQRIPVDAVVIGGMSEIDASAVTGEPLPVTVGPGDQVAAGCLNGTGSILVRTIADGAHSTVARIAEASTLEAALRLAAAPGVEAVFASCTNLRTLGIVEAAEAESGRPFLSSNLALGWRMLSLAGLPPAEAAPGRLMQGLRAG
jgi:Cu+-exporting ATPase